LREIEIRAMEEELRRREAEREAATRQELWEAALARAEERYVENRRGEVLRAQVEEWRRAELIREFCDASQKAHPDDSDVAEWIGWARAFADTIDPIHRGPCAPTIDSASSPGDLRPFLDGWDPYQPVRDRTLV
jgi:hypothetical protein